MDRSWRGKTAGYSTQPLAGHGQICSSKLVGWFITVQDAMTCNGLWLCGFVLKRDKRSTPTCTLVSASWALLMAEPSRVFQQNKTTWSYKRNISKQQNRDST